MLTYLRFGLINLFQLTALGLMLSGGPWLWLFAGLVVVFPSLDNVLADDRDHPAYQQSWLLNALLYLNLPILLLLTVLFGYLISGSDPLSLGLISGQTFGFDLAARRGNITTVELVTSGLALGLFYGAAGINVAHELIHRLNRPLDLLFGRWLLAFTWDTTFAIEHIHGHHVHVATMTDPATARRGEYIGPIRVRLSQQGLDGPVHVACHCRFVLPAGGLVGGGGVFDVGCQWQALSRSGQLYRTLRAGPDRRTTGQGAAFVGLLPGDLSGVLIQSAPPCRSPSGRCQAVLA
jgi:hypothetical protein